jgi:hypothetical protein
MPLEFIHVSELSQRPINTSWGPWSLRGDQLVLVEDQREVYTIPLNRLGEPDWITHVAQKDWDVSVVGHFARALAELAPVYAAPPIPEFVQDRELKRETHAKTSPLEFVVAKLHPLGTDCYSFSIREHTEPEDPHFMVSYHWPTANGMGATELNGGSMEVSETELVTLARTILARFGHRR